MFSMIVGVDVLRTELTEEHIERRDSMHYECRMLFSSYIYSGLVNINTDVGVGSQITGFSWVYQN